MQFNDNQKAAINHKDGPALVIAGPGSGKTLVITERAKQLINKHKINPKEILIITFTKYAAKEMEYRFKESAGENNAPIFGTFHSIFFRILCSLFNYNPENVIKDEEKFNIIKQMLIELKIEYEDEKEFISSILGEISLIKNELIEIKNYNPMSMSKDEFQKIYKYYEIYKKNNNKLDFDDMLVWVYMLFKKDKQLLSKYKEKYRYIMIDEFQDINRVQFETIRMLASPLNNIFVVGDDDQSIYKFRGAKPELFLKFPEVFKGTKKIFLDINYRCVEPIVKISNKLISNNCKRYDKNICATKNEKIKPKIIASKDTNDEAEKIIKYLVDFNKKGKIKFNDIAVIFRTNIQARSFVEKFTDYKIPFYLKDEVPDIYNHWIVRDILAYIKASKGIDYNRSILQIINRPNRYISKENIKNVQEEKDVLKGLVHLNGIKKYQIIKLNELDTYLHTLKNKRFFSAISYIRNTIGYNDYLKEYAENRKISYKELAEIADEFEDSVKELKSYEDFLEHMSIVKKELENNKKNISKDRVVLTTMHSAKGLEFDVVFVAGVAEGIVPHEKALRFTSDIEEERRLLYVAMTRAKKHLFISNLERRYEKKLEESRFIKEMI